MDDRNDFSVMLRINALQPIKGRGRPRKTMPALDKEDPQDLQSERRLKSLALALR